MTKQTCFFSHEYWYSLFLHSHSVDNLLSAESLMWFVALFAGANYSCKTGFALVSFSFSNGLVLILIPIKTSNCL